MTVTLFWLSILYVFYTYIGYPLIIALFAAFRSKPAYNEKYYPSVTLLIAAYNEEFAISKKIENSLALEYPKEKLQILIVADGSSDRTPDIAKQYQARGAGS